MDSYLTLREGVEIQSEFLDRKSRFIAQLTHIETEQEANQFITEIRSKHYDARHNVPAWVLSDGRERASDDGEPQRTSGMPTLEVLRGVGLANVCCVVTRYFGGTLLGPGGLIRAYTTATQQAVEEAYSQGAIVEMTLVVDVDVTIPYAMLDRVLDLSMRCGAHERGCEYAADVVLSLTFKNGEQIPFLQAMNELACGKNLCKVSDPAFAEF